MSNPHLTQPMREILHLLEITPLTTGEVAQVRDARQPTTHHTLRVLEHRGYVRRFAQARDLDPHGRTRRAALFHWTGKPFARLPTSLALSDLCMRACRLAEPCAVRRELAAKGDKPWSR